MQIITKENLKTDGKLILIYGATGTGKTTSIFQSAPDPMLYIATEPRNPTPSIEAANRPDLRVDFVRYINWYDFMGFLQNHEQLCKYKTIVVDSLTFLMNIGLSAEIEDEIFDTKTDIEKKRKTIIAQTKMSVEGYGGMASQMSRMLKALGRLTQEGIIVICTALEHSNPKWDRELVAAPAFKGREFPNNMPGFFDLIGLVETRTKDNKVVYPPLVSFESPNGNFMAKFTGVSDKKRGPLDFGKIL